MVDASMLSWVLAAVVTVTMVDDAKSSNVRQPIAIWYPLDDRLDMKPVALDNQRRHYF